jgi:ABC-type oligopeptide transport system substrate-binding subunit
MMICFTHIVEIICEETSQEQVETALYYYIRHHPSILKTILSKKSSLTDELKDSSLFDSLRNDKRGVRLPVDGYIMGKRNE